MKRYKLLISFLLVVFALIIIISIGYAYDDKKTHPDLTETAIKQDNCVMNDYFKKFLGFPQGVTTQYGESKDAPTVIDLVKAGSTNEDSGFWRAQNHFYNPIHNEGLDDLDIARAISITGLPNLYWAMGYTDDGLSLDSCGYGDFFSDNECNDYSWRRAQDYFYLALTCPTEATRNDAFIKFYERLGRVLHLLEDVAVPAHTRNDLAGHLNPQEINWGNPKNWVGDVYEYWVKQNPTFITDPKTPFVINTPDFTKAEHSWDKEVYSGADPDVTLPIDGKEQCGLAEYSNANFLSKCTMFTEDLPFGDRHYFPYPKKSSVVDLFTTQVVPEERLFPPHTRFRFV